MDKILILLQPARGLARPAQHPPAFGRLLGQHELITGLAPDRIHKGVEAGRLLCAARLGVRALVGNTPRIGIVGFHGLAGL